MAGLYTFTKYRAEMPAPILCHDQKTNRDYERLSETGEALIHSMLLRFAPLCWAARPL